MGGIFFIEIKAFAGDDKFYSYFDPESVESCRKALDDLDAYIAAEGPFDAILAFSQGAALAATLIVRKFSQESKQQHVNPTFKCAVFLSGGVPCDPSALLRDELRILDHASDGEVIPVPTANIWGSNDLSWPPELSKLCMAQGRTVFIHDGGHEVPGSKSKPALTGTVQAIRRTVDKALYTH